MKNVRYDNSNDGHLLSKSAFFKPSHICGAAMEIWIILPKIFVHYSLSRVSARAKLSEMYSFKNLLRQILRGSNY